MRAAQVMRLDGPDAIEVSEIDEPSGDGVVVDVHAAGVAFPDALLSRGLYQYKLEPPFVVGGEIAGRGAKRTGRQPRAAGGPGRRADDDQRRHGGGRRARSAAGVQAARQRQLRGRAPACCSTTSRCIFALTVRGPAAATAKRCWCTARPAASARRHCGSRRCSARPARSRSSAARTRPTSRPPPGPPTSCWPTASRTRSRS